MPEKQPENPLNYFLTIIGITTICSVTICLICGFMGLKVAQMRRKIKCPMCKLWVESKHWHNGKHREFCAKRNENFLKKGAFINHVDDFDPFLVPF